MGLISLVKRNKYEKNMTKLSHKASTPPLSRKTHSDHPYQGSGVRAYHSIYNLGSMVVDTLSVCNGESLSE